MSKVQELILTVLTEAIDEGRKHVSLESISRRVRDQFDCHHDTIKFRLDALVEQRIIEEYGVHYTLAVNRDKDTEDSPFTDFRNAIEEYNKACDEFATAVARSMVGMCPGDIDYGYDLFWKAKLINQIYNKKVGRCRINDKDTESPPWSGSYWTRQTPVEAKQQAVAREKQQEKDTNE